jgi:decaprenylphospho-beta-D-ribofuranose 2-oxidase
MGHDPVERCGNGGARELLRSYSRLDSACAEVKRPADVAELAELLIAARDDGRRVTFRAGGMSLHDQSLNDDLVISLERFHEIGPIDVTRQTISVGAGARWGDIVAATLPHDLVPYVVVTSKRCTAGGTLASDGISRYSPSYGSESVHIESFDILFVGATAVRTILRPDPDDRDSEDAKLFRAVIGGFGYLGVVTRITHRLLSVREVAGQGPVEVLTELATYEHFDDLVAAQIALLEEPIEEDLEHWEFPNHALAEEYPAVYAVAFPHKGNGRGAVYKSHYSRGVKGKPYVIYRPDAWYRKLMGYLLTKPALKPLVNFAVWRSMKGDAGKTFVNDVFDYMFFMDGEVAFKESYEHPPNRLARVVQQTFVVHYGKAAEFLDEIPEILQAEKIEPTLFEFLFMPRDRVLMSASYEMPGFAITLAFQDIRCEERRRAAIRAIEKISSLCHHSFGGRIHFTKNVYAEPDVIRGMYGERATAFLALKDHYDPHRVLRNAFFERIFP